MNEHEPAASQTTPTASPPASEKPSVLRKILFGILAVMVVALIYEYGFVLRSYRNAENTIDDLIDQQGAATAEEKATPALVQQKFGKQPLADVQDTEDYYVEHYQWRRWLPWKTFDIYVIYTQGTPRTLFYSTRPNPPTEGDLPMKYDFPAVTDAAPDLSPPPAEGDDPFAEPSVGDDAASGNDAAEGDAPPSGTEDAPADAADAPADPAIESPSEPADAPADEAAGEKAPADRPVDDASENDETQAE